MALAIIASLRALAGVRASARFAREYPGVERRMACRQSMYRHRAIGWGLCALLFLIFLLERHLHLVEHATAQLRRVARGGGWYLQRRTVQMVLVACAALSIPLVIRIVRAAARHSLRRERSVIAGLLLLGVLLGAELISWHPLDEILWSRAVFGAPLIWLLVLLAVVIIVASAWRGRHPAPAAGS